MWASVAHKTTSRELAGRISWRAYEPTDLRGGWRSGGEGRVRSTGLDRGVCGRGIRRGFPGSAVRFGRSRDRTAGERPTRGSGGAGRRGSGRGAFGRSRRCRLGVERRRECVLRRRGGGSTRRWSGGVRRGGWRGRGALRRPRRRGSGRRRCGRRRGRRWGVSVAGVAGRGAGRGWWVRGGGACGCARRATGVGFQSAWGWGVFSDPSGSGELRRISTRRTRRASASRTVKV